jgi:sugar phosphate isomerase/epimerase
MIWNTNDGTAAPPALRRYLNLMTLEDLPSFSAAPKTCEPEALLTAIREAGYDGVQFITPVSSAERAACSRLGLGYASLGRVNEPGEMAPQAERFAGEGVECATLHLGWGLEDDDVANRLIEAVLAASDRYRVPLYVETHRATIFQDPWRTVQFVKRFPELRFNGDFSHWYTGLEMVYGGFETKLEFIRPVLQRVRFIHGRIGNPGSMQVDIGKGDTERHPYVAHFRALWTEAFRGFLGGATSGDYVLFVPELLSPRIYYARLLRKANAELVEECDRWEQSLVLCGIATECFTTALQLPWPPDPAGLR